MTHTNLRQALLVVVLVSACLHAQGVGTPGSTGFIPRLSVDHRQVGVLDALRIADVAPFAPLGLVASVAEASIPLASFGLAPAILGVDPAQGVILTGMTSTASGDFTLPFLTHPAFAHQPVYLQALAVDAGAPFGGVAVSAAFDLVMGLDRARLPLAVPTGVNRSALVEVFGYGVLAGDPDARLLDVHAVDLGLVNTVEESFGRIDRPTPYDVAGLGRGVRMPDGSIFVAVRSTTNEDGLVRIAPDGAIEVLVWLQGNAADQAFFLDVAASPFEPWIALAVAQPGPSINNCKLALVRTDGRNVPGQLTAAIGIPTPGNIEIDPGSLVFLNGALFFGDANTILHRLDLGSLSVSTVVFPPSGGSVPVEIDESVAPADDASAFAIGAGASQTVKDVYAVSAAGVAVNVTNAPSNYDDAGFGVWDGGQLAMNGDGTKVAYMHFFGLDDELFVQDVPSGQPAAQVTNGTQFVDSIDTVVGLGFAANGDLLFVSGHDEQTMDVYRAPTPPTGPVSSIVNLSATSGYTAPIFGFGATLTHESRFTMPSSRLHVLFDSAGPRRVQVVDPTGGSTAFAVGSIVATAPVGATASLLVDQTSTGQVRVRCINDAAGSPLGLDWTSAQTAVFAAQAHDPVTGGAALLFDGLTGDTVVVCRPGQPTLIVAAPAADMAPSLTFDGDGSLVAVARNLAAQTVELHRLDEANSTWLPFGSSLPIGLEGRFLR